MAGFFALAGLFLGLVALVVRFEADFTTAFLALALVVFLAGAILLRSCAEKKIAEALEDDVSKARRGNFLARKQLYSLQLESLLVTVKHKRFLLDSIQTKSRSKNEKKKKKSLVVSNLLEDASSKSKARIVPCAHYL